MVYDSKLFVPHSVASLHAVIRKLVHSFGKVSIIVTMLLLIVFGVATCSISHEPFYDGILFF